MPNPRGAKFATTKARNAYNLASFIIGTEVANVINVAVRLKDARNKNIPGPVFVRAYLSDVPAATDVTATVTTSAIAIGTNGKVIFTPVSGKMVDVLSDVNGQFDLNIPQTAAPVTYYLALVFPDGTIVVSGAITFA